MNNDFQIQLLKFINSLDLPLTARLDYFNAYDDIVVNPLPGGKVLSEYMDGTKEVSLQFEIAVKSTDNQKANDIIWTINTSLSDIGVNIPSDNNSYSFIKLEVSKPAVSGKDEQGYYIYTQNLEANLEI